MEMDRAVSIGADTREIQKQLMMDRRHSREKRPKPGLDVSFQDPGQRGRLAEPDRVLGATGVWPIRCPG